MKTVRSWLIEQWMFSNKTGKFWNWLGISGRRKDQLEEGKKGAVGLRVVQTNLTLSQYLKHSLTISIFNLESTGVYNFQQLFGHHVLIICLSHHWKMFFSFFVIVCLFIDEHEFGVISESMYFSLTKNFRKMHVSQKPPLRVVNWWVTLVESASPLPSEWSTTSKPSYWQTPELKSWAAATASNGESDQQWGLKSWPRPHLHIRLSSWWPENANSPTLFSAPYICGGVYLWESEYESTAANWITHKISTLNNNEHLSPHTISVGPGFKHGLF